MILALETSTTHGQVVLMDSSNEALIAEAHFEAPRSRLSALFEALPEVLSAASQPLEGIVVGTGPGSYTGVRVGIAAAMGLSLAHACPTFGFPSIVTLAQAALVTGNARRSSFYVAKVENHRLINAPEILDADSFRKRLRDTPLPAVTMDSEAPLGIESIQICKPSARLLAENAIKLSQEDRDLAAQTSVEPLYLQAPFITQPKRKMESP